MDGMFEIAEEDSSNNRYVHARFTMKDGCLTVEIDPTDYYGKTHMLSPDEVKRLRELIDEKKT